MSNQQVINEESLQNSDAADDLVSGEASESRGLLNVSKDMIAAAGFHVETPIVNALIGNLTGSLPTKKSEATESVRCDICDCEISSSIIMNFHLNGAKHKKRLKALEIISNLKAEGKNGVKIGDDDNPNNFRCEVCHLTVNSAQQLEFHLSGTKHQKNAIKAGLIKPVSECETDSPHNESPTETQSETDSKRKNSGEDNGAPPQKIKKKEEPKQYPCLLCNVTMNSEMQYNQHLSSKKHTGKSNWNTKAGKTPIQRKPFVSTNNGGSSQTFNSNLRFQNGKNQFAGDNLPQGFNSQSNVQFRNPFYDNLNSNSNGNNMSNNFKKPFRNFNNLPKDSRFRPHTGNNVRSPWFNSNFSSHRSF